LPRQAGSVAPKIFQAVEAALFRMENVHDHLHVIEYDPLAGGESVDRGRTHGMIFLELRFDLTRDRL